MQSSSPRAASVLVAAFMSMAATASAPTETPPPVTVVAFVDVNVVPCDGPQVSKRQTVVVRGDRIVAVGPVASTAVPEGAVVLEGSGRWLMPGLADMHVHAWSPGDLVAFVTNGVTTIRNMFGAPLHLQWRDSLAAGTLFGPTLYTAGPIIDGDPPTWPGSTVLVDPAKAAKVVARQKKAGYDFLKVYNGLSPEVYDALVAAASEAGMPFAGHVPTAVPLEHALSSGQRSIEHLSGYGFALGGDRVEPGEGPMGTWLRVWERADTERVSGLAAATREAGTWICPTLGVFDGMFAPDELADRMLQRDEMRFVHPSFRAFWQQRRGGSGLRSVLEAGVPNRDRMTRALHRAGARLVLGTDCPNPFLVPGFSIHGEMEHWVEAGIAPVDVLRAGTREAAALMGDLDEFGTVSAGKRADLLLLEADPLEDIANVRKRVGVMLRGQWLPEADLRRRLADVAASYGAAEP